MNNCLLTKAAVSLCLVSALGMSASDYTPWNPFAPQKAEKIRNKTAGESRFAPKSVENGIILPDLEQNVTYHRVATTSGIVAAPDGSDWFYTLELEGDKLVDNPYNTEYDYKSFHVKVYDAKFNFVGQAKGEVERPEGAIKCQSITVGEFLSKSFFNTNSNDIEVTITSNFNPGPVDGVARYGAKQTTEAYTLTTEIPAEGLSTRVFHAPGYIISSINAGDNVSENYVMALAEETSWDGEDVNHADYTIYKKAGWGTPASEVTRFKVDLTLAYSDGYNEAFPCVMTTKGSDVYIATALYEKTFLDDPTEEDPSQSTGNNYVITLYKASGNKYTEVAKTKIPCEGPEGSDYQFRSYALGNFSGAADITFDFGDGANPCYIISVIDSGTTDDTSAYYAVYDLEGNEINRFGNGSDGYVKFWDLKGHPMQYGFDMVSKDDEYATVLVDYPSLEEVGIVPKMFEYDGEIWSAVSTPDRTIVDGKVMYAVSVRVSSADTENVADYVAWFTPDGELHHIDTLAFGDDVAKVLTNLNGSVLNPYLFNTDSKLEYLAWVYRYLPGNLGTTLELAVCDGSGKLIATRKLGNNNNIAGPFAYVANAATDASIMITYRTLDDNRKWYVKHELINLPLNKFDGEGTAESPFIIKTYGDLDQVRNNLTAHFRLAGDIDCEGQSFRPIEGEFTGSLDGNGFSIKNLTVVTESSNSGIFCKLGKAAYYVIDPKTEEPKLVTPDVTVLKNVTFANPSIVYNGNSLGLKNLALIAGEAKNARFENVFVTTPQYTLDATSTLNVRFGVMANNASDVAFESCGVKDANISIPRSTGLGGLVYEARGCSFSACSFSGNLLGRSNIGGIAANALTDLSTFADCHVNATIEGESNIGGILASSNRSPIVRAVVEGSIKADENVGGIVGKLDTREGTDETIVIDNCVVALADFTLPENATAAHRIVGYSSIDDGDTYEYIPDPDNPEGNATVVTHPAEHEKYLGKNYVISGIDAVEQGDLATEGTTVSISSVNMDWYSELGFKFGTTTAAPWKMQYMDKIPSLYFESIIGKSIQFSPAEVTGKPGESYDAVLVLTGIEAAVFGEAIGNGEVELTSTDESIATFNYMMDFGANENELVFGVSFVAEGTADLTISYNGLNAVLKVTVTTESGITDVTVDNELTYSAGIVSAEGCTIELYDLQGRRVATGNGTLSTESLGSGIYVARAINADGKTSVLKISVK